MNNLSPDISNPFYIVSPPYTRKSAGVHALHLLCHYLNRGGHLAYMLQYPFHTLPDRSLPGSMAVQDMGEYPGMLAPPLTEDVIRYFDEQAITPIVIYPEVYDNPYNVAFFGRFILNYPGRLAPAYVQRAAFTFFYSRILADSVVGEDAPADVLFMPTCDLDYWTPSEGTVRSGTCFYAGKLKEIHNERADRHPSDAVEILRSTTMSRDEIRDIFRHSTALYCYEDTALAIEARLCGCPVVFVPNTHFNGRPLAEVETGTLGACGIDEQDGLARATATVAGFRDNLRGRMQLAVTEIDRLASFWKGLVAKEAYQGTVKLDMAPRIILFRDPPAGSVGFEEQVEGADILPTLAARADFGIPKETRPNKRRFPRDAIRAARRAIRRLRYDPSDYGIPRETRGGKGRFPRDAVRFCRRCYRRLFDIH